MEIEHELMKQTSHKPGNGHGDKGHDGPPGHKKDYDEYGYESELWEL